MHCLNNKNRLVLKHMRLNYDHHHFEHFTEFQIIQISGPEIDLVLP